MNSKKNNHYFKKYEVLVEQIGSKNPEEKMQLAYQMIFNKILNKYNKNE